MRPILARSGEFICVNAPLAQAVTDCKKKLAENKPIAVRVDKNQIFDLLIRITEANVDDLDGGFVVVGVPYSKAANEEAALKIGVAIRDEVRRQIPSKSAMFRQ